MNSETPRAVTNDVPAEESTPNRCSWTELKAIVGDLRREIAAISSLQPMQIRFRRMSDGNVRLYYLVNSPDCWTVPLLYVDVSNDVNDEAARFVQLVGRCGIDCVPETSCKRSREQQLLSERQRSSTCGLITSYQLHGAEPCIVFPMSDGLYIIDNIESSSIPLPLRTRDGSPLAPAMNPSSPWLVAHTCRGDLWVTSRRINGCPVRLTYACRGLPRLADDPREASIPSYVMQEEFSRYTGFWWQPVRKDNVYRILYEEVDESGVDIFSFPAYNRHNGDVEEFRFPRAGMTNARSILRMVQFRISEQKNNTYPSSNRNCVLNTLDIDEDIDKEDDEIIGSICDIQWFDLRRPLEEEFPWCEYISRIGWTPCGRYVWCQILDRRQQRLDIVLIPLEEFCVPFRYEMAPVSSKNIPLLPPAPPPPDRIPVQVILSERNPNTWINVHDILHFLPMNDPTEIRFIWASEETGHLHLYLVTSSIKGSCKKLEVSHSLLNNESTMQSKVALTKGDWEVIGKKIWVDEKEGLIYFIGLRESPLERHLYCTSYLWNIGSNIELLTQPGFSHNVDMDEKCEVAVITRSNLFSKPSCVVFKIEHVPWRGPQSISLRFYGSLCHPSEISSGIQQTLLMDWTERIESPWTGWKPSMNKVKGLERRYIPELFSTRLNGGSGEEIHAMVFRPVGEAGNKKCPTVLHVYGGPVVQTVTNTFKGMRQLRMHMMAARGYCVVCIDSRGSKHRGMKFESHIRCRMGTVELEDQIEVLRWLADQTGCIDLNRVAVHGWSYGGYLSLMALIQYPKIFKVCIACAPVTSWHLYDTAYTERYMDLPNLNPAGYARGNVLKYAEQFPDQENRLLIVHGLQDENVHFLHTQQLIEALVKAGKPYQLQVYPGERHSLRHPEASAHYEATLLSFLQNNL